MTRTSVRVINKGVGKRNVFVFLVVFCFAQKISVAQWHDVLGMSNYKFNNVYFLNKDTGFVTGYSGPPSSDKIIIRTLDGGYSWDFTSILLWMTSIHFANDSVGFAGGQDGSVYKTTNMGVTWINYSTVTTNTDYTSMYFVNPQKGFVTGYYGNIYNTMNGAITWTGSGSFPSNACSSYPGTAKFFFVDSLIGFSARGEFAWGTPCHAITKTTDGGNTWADLPIPANFYPYSTFFIDSLRGYAVGFHGKVSRTTDGGASWSTPDSICRYELFDIAFVNDSIGYISGGKSSERPSAASPGPNKGIIFKTIDRGNTWQVMDSSFTDGLIKMHFPTNSVGYIAGSGSKVLKLTGANSIYTTISELSTTNTEITIYPNPTTNQLTINSTQLTIESIHIYNVLGECLHQSEIHNPQSEISVDVSALSKGIYFIEIKTVDSASSPTKGIVRKKVVKE